MAPSSKSSQLSEIRPKDVEKDVVQEYSPEFEKKTIVNLGVARIAGMEKDLVISISILRPGIGLTNATPRNLESATVIALHHAFTSFPMSSGESL
ncbi:hypothetical protein C0995_000827 [Termitomyces sp. Mi166|nr:hypothetical protein C0995_000827 [Termitomyces sp. Mi166\